MFPFASANTALNEKYISCSLSYSSSGTTISVGGSPSIIRSKGMSVPELSPDLNVTNSDNSERVANSPVSGLYKSSVKVMDNESPWSTSTAPSSASASPPGGNWSKRKI